MSTKAQLEAIRDTNWNDTATDSPSTPLRDPVCDRTIFDALVSELYPTAVVDSETLETYTTKSGSNIDYDLTIIKQGNICHLKILLDNTTGSTLSAQSIFTWKSSEFKPKATVNGIVFSVLSGTSGSASATLFLDDAGVTLNSNLPTSPSYSSVYITYIAQD